MVGVRMEDKISEIAGVKLVGAGSIEWDRRLLGTFTLRRPPSTDSV